MSNGNVQNMSFLIIMQLSQMIVLLTFISSLQTGVERMVTLENTPRGLLAVNSSVFKRLHADDGFGGQLEWCHIVGENVPNNA